MKSFRFAMALIAMVLVATPNVQATDLTVGDLAYGDVVGSASDTRFNYPPSVEVLSGDEVALVADKNNNRIVNVSLADGSTNEFMTTGSVGPNFLAVCDDGVGYFSAVGDDVQEFNTSDTSPSASPWVPVSSAGFGLACLKNSTHNLLFVADYAVGIRAYDRTNGPPANQDDFVWEATVAHLGVSRLVGISLSPDLRHLAFASYGQHKVGTINLETNAKQLFGSGTKGDQDGTADVAQFYLPWDIVWTSGGHKILVNQNGGSFRGLRFIDFATGDVSSSADGLMPTNKGYGVTVLRSTGEVVVTYEHGLKKMSVDGVTNECPLADLDLAHFPLAANKPSSDFRLGQLIELDQCVPGYTASGNLAIKCGASGWTLQVNSFFCTDTALLARFEASQVVIEAAQVVIDELRANATLDRQTITALKPQIQADFAAVEVDITSIQAHVSILQGNVTTLSNAIQDNTGDIAQLRDNLTQTQADVAVLEINATSAADAMDALEQDVNDNVMAVIQDNSQALLSQNVSIEQAHKDIVTIQSSIDTIQDDVVANEDDIASNANSIQALEPNITAVQSAVNDLASETTDKFAAVQNDVDSIQNDVTVLQGKSSGQADTLNAHNNSITQAQQDIASLKQVDQETIARTDQLANNVGQLRNNLTNMQSAVDDLASETTDKFGAVQNDVDSIQNDVTVLQGKSSAQAGTIDAIQTDLDDNVKAPIQDQANTLDAHNNSITQAQQDIASLKQADQEAIALTDQLANNITHSKTEIAQVSQEVNAVDFKADAAKTAGDENARTVSDVQDKAATDNGSALAIGIVALLIGLAAVIGAVVYVKKAKTQTQQQQAVDVIMTPVTAGV